MKQAVASTSRCIVRRSRPQLPARTATPIALHKSYYATESEQQSSSSQQSQSQQRKEKQKESEPELTAGTSPFAIFVQVIKDELERNRELSAATRQLGGKVDEYADSKAWGAMRTAYERTLARSSILFICLQQLMSKLDWTAHCVHTKQPKAEESSRRPCKARRQGQRSYRRSHLSILRLPLPAVRRASYLSSVGTDQAD